MLKASLLENHTLTPGQQVYTQLPKNGERCRISGLSRSALNSIILPTAANGFKPPVKSLSLKTHKHASRGVRLIHIPSLLEFLDAQQSATAKPQA